MDANDAKNETSSFYSRPPITDTSGSKIWYEGYSIHQWDPLQRTLRVLRGHKRLVLFKYVPRVTL